MSDIFEAFDASITYDKPNGRLILAAAIRPDLDPKLQNDDDRPGERSLISQVAGERFVLIGDPLALVERVVPWPCA